MLINTVLKGTVKISSKNTFLRNQESIVLSFNSLADIIHNLSSMIDHNDEYCYTVRRHCILEDAFKLLAIPSFSPQKKLVV